MYCLVKVEPLISYKSLSCFQFKPLLESTLQADQKLEEGAKKLEKEQLERKRQEELAKQRQVIIKLIALTGKDLDNMNSDGRMLIAPPLIPGAYISWSSKILDRYCHHRSDNDIIIPRYVGLRI